MTQVIWQQSTEEVYWDALGALPPALRMSGGFLLGEAYSDRTCGITGKLAITYWAYTEVRGRYFKASIPLTVSEFTEDARKGFPTTSEE